MNKRIIVTTISLAILMTSHVAADHDHDALRESYELQKSEFTQAYRAERRALRVSYRQSREQLLADRELIHRIDCPETRSRRLRHNSRELGLLAREHGRQNRELSLAYHDGMQRMRQSYRRAREARRGSSGVHPRVLVQHAHPADCTCQACVPPMPPAPVYREHYDDPIVHRHDHRIHDRRERRRKPNGLDIALAILNLL